MKFWIIYFPINDPGGIDTYMGNLRDGLRLLGHEVDFSYATLGTGMQKLDPKQYSRMGGKIRGEDRLPGTLVSYGTDEGIRDYVTRTKSYDACIFAQPSPHDIKSYTDPDMRWLRLYSEAEAPTMVIFHDDSWKKTNTWARQIPAYCEGILFAQYMFYMYALSGDDALTCEEHNFVSWLSFPLVENSDIGLYDEYKIVSPRRIGVCLAQWAAWKNHAKLLPQLEGVDTFELDVYGAARMQYYYQRKEEYWKRVLGYDAVADVYHNTAQPHQIMGYVPYADVPGILQEASIAIDASTKGRENMAMLEAMAYGAVSVVTTEALNATNYQLLTEDVTVIAPLDDLIMAAEDVCMNFDLYRAEREAGLEFVRQHHTLEGVARQVEQLALAIADGETGLFPEGLEKWAN